MKQILGITGALFIILLFATCSSQKLSNVNEQEMKVVSELRDNINKQINDNGKRSALLKITDEIEQETRRFFSFYQEHNKRLTRVNYDYMATRQDFEQIVSEFNVKYEDYFKILIQKRTAMRKLINDEEWKKIMDKEYSFIPG